MNHQTRIAVVGLWHLGCCAAAAWLKKGYQVIGIDFDEKLIQGLSHGKPPLYEPHLEETLQTALQESKITFSTDPEKVSGCDFVFLTYDTPTDEKDLYNLQPLEEALGKICPHLSLGASLIVSSQVPVGTCSKWEKQFNCSIVYSPENLKLSEAIENYLNPGHIVIGADKPKALEKVKELFSNITANSIPMSLKSAEMTKHAINAFLASSITFANQLSDACGLSGADFSQVISAMKQDLRIGEKAYMNAGIGFSGGTLGRDLRILSQLNKTRGGGTFPFFQEIWQHNQQRPRLLVHKIGKILKHFASKNIAILGLTYKPGTSTLRRSLPLEIALDLIRKQSNVKAYDPKADWSERNELGAIEIVNNPLDVAKDADFLLILTPWPEFKGLDFETIGKSMREKKAL